MEAQRSYENQCLSSKLYNVTFKRARILIEFVATNWLRHNCGYKFVESGGRAVSGAGLRPLD